MFDRRQQGRWAAGRNSRNNFADDSPVQAMPRLPAARVAVAVSMRIESVF